MTRKIRYVLHVEVNSSNVRNAIYRHAVDTLRDIVGWEEVVGAFGAEGRWFDSTSSRHVGTWASPSLVIACMTWSGALLPPCG